MVYSMNASVWGGVARQAIVIAYYRSGVGTISKFYQLMYAPTGMTATLF